MSTVTIDALPWLPPLAVADVVIAISLVSVVAWEVHTTIDNVFDVSVDLSNRDVQLFDSNVRKFFGQFTVAEAVLVLVSVYYQYTVVTPRTGFQSLMKNLTYLFIFSIVIYQLLSTHVVE